MRGGTLIAHDGEPCDSSPACRSDSCCHALISGSRRSSATPRTRSIAPPIGGRTPRPSPRSRPTRGRASISSAGRSSSRTSRATRATVATTPLSRLSKRLRSRRGARKCFSASSTARPGSRQASTRRPSRRSSARGDLLVTDLRVDRDGRAARAGASAAARRGEGGARLACAAPLLRQLRDAEPRGRRRLAARLSGLRHATFSAHRSRGDHARDRRRALPARAQPALCAAHVVVPRGLRRAGRDHRRGGAARDPARSPASCAGASPISPRSRGRFRCR